MSKNFYKNTRDGMCQTIVFKQLSESLNMSFDEFIKFFDSRRKYTLTEYMSLWSNEDNFNMDVRSFLSKCWKHIEFKHLTMDNLLLISMFLQLVAEGMTGIDVIEWKNDKSLHMVTEEHYQNLYSYINDAKRYTNNVPIICYYIYLNEDGTKDEVGHVYMTFYDVKQDQYFNYNSNHEHPFLVHKPKLVEYIAFEGLINFHGSILPMIYKLFGGYNRSRLYIIYIMIALIIIVLCLCKHYIRIRSNN